MNEAEREKYEAIIADMAKLLELQQKSEGVVIDMIAAAVKAEREACAKECEDLRKFFAGSDFAVDREEHYVPGNSLAYTQCAAAIRARGEREELR